MAEESKDECKSQNNDGLVLRSDYNKNIICIPAGSRYSKENIQNRSGDKLCDRRYRVKPWQDCPAIFKCIGRIESDFGEKHKGKPAADFGTGTVFKVKDGFAYIITCAHNVIKKDVNQKNILPKSIKFVREAGEFDVKTYDVHEVEKNVTVHGKYKFATNDPNDLAVLRFKDNDGFYGKIFKENERIINLFSSDDINDKTPVGYYLFGYPCGKDKDSKATDDSQLWGMEADFGCDNTQFYVRRNDANSLFYYNAIDTEGGQSGSSIYVLLTDYTVGIVGIHTEGGYNKNYGVSLKKKKIEWIQSQFSSKSNGWGMSLMQSLSNKSTKSSSKQSPQKPPQQISINVIKSTMQSPQKPPQQNLHQSNHHKNHHNKYQMLLHDEITMLLMISDKGSPPLDESFYTAEGSSDIFLQFVCNNNQHYIPTKCIIRGWNHESSLKQFQIYIGDGDKWIPANDKLLTAEKSEEYQSFSLSLIDNNNLILEIKENKYKHYKMEIINNHDSPYLTTLYEFQLFGIEY